MKLNTLILSLAILLLASCCKDCLNNSVKITPPTQTRSGVTYTDNLPPVSRLAWWTKLHDPVLNQLMAQALAQNYKLERAKYTILQAKAQLKSAQYAWLPTLDGSARGFSGRTWDTSITPQGALANTPLFSNLTNLQFHGYYTGFMPSYSVNILNNISNIKAAKATLAIQRAQAQATRLAIISQLSGTYFMLLSQKAQLVAEKTLVNDLKALRQLEKIRFKEGANNIETITSMRQDLSQEASKIPQIEKVIEQSENTIRLLLNQNPGQVKTKLTLMQLDVKKVLPRRLPSSVLKNRPDILIAVNNVKMACAQIGVSYSTFFPTLALSGLLGESSIDLTHLLKLSTAFWVSQAYASMSLLNASAYQNVKSAKAGLKAASYDYLETLHSVFADVDTNLTNEQKNLQAYALIEQATQAAQKTYGIALAQYQAGAKDYRAVLNAKINLDRNKLNLIQQKAQVMDGLVQVYNAIAGGSEVYIKKQRQ